MRAEPRLRVVRVRIGAETGKRREGARGPLPDLAPVHRGRRVGPFRFARQPATRPAAIRLRLVPAHVPHWLVRHERPPAIEAPLLPLSVHAAPIARRRAARFDVDQVLSVAHRARSNREGLYLDIVRPLLVVEDEALLVAPGAEAERAAGELQEFRSRVAMNCDPGSEFGLGVAVGLVGVVQRLGVHVLVQRGEAHEVGERLVVGLARQAVQRFLQHGTEVAACGRQARQRQIPARVVRDGRGVIERIGIRQDRGREFPAIAPAQAPMLLEPADVTDLPERWIDDREPRTAQLLAVKPRRDAGKVISAGDEIRR